MIQLVFSILLLCAVTVNASPEQLPELSNDRVIFHTNLGDIAVGFYPSVAPKHVAQILEMVRAGVYTGTAIYRIEPGFVAQLSNFDQRAVPLSDAERAVVNKLPGEFSPIHHRRGLLSMARYDDPNSAESSFSFMLGDAPHLDGKYTIFGAVVGGMEVLDKIEQVPTATRSEPTEDVTINSAEVITAAQLAETRLEPAHQPVLPGQKSNAYFEVFAALMFAITIALPIIKALMAKSPPALAKN